MIVRKAPTTASRIIEGEAVVLSMETKVLRGLNPVGSRVWELIDGERSLAQIVELVLEEFEVTRSEAAQDVESFVRELLDKGLVTRVG